MTAIKWAAGTAALIALCSPAQSGELSITCHLGMLVESHAMLGHCNQAISAEDEQRYAELKTQLEAFVRQNRIPGRRMIPIDETEIRDHLKKIRFTCDSADYFSARSLFYELVSPAQISAARALLQQPTDPDEGDCL
jgi:hypothetical protein